MRIVIGFFLFCLSAFAQCTSPCLAAVGGIGSTTYTTGAIVTTGAKFFAYSLSYVTSSSPVISDNAGNSTPTCLTFESNGGGGNSAICYLINPVTSNSHTFTVTAAGTFFSSVQVAAFSTANLTYTSLFSGTTIAGPVSTYQPGSVTPHATGDLLISSISACCFGGSVLSIGGGFTIAGQQSYSGGFAFGSGLAYLVAPSGSAVNPTWTNSNTGSAGLSLASFTVASSGTAVSNLFAPFAPF